MVKAIRIYVEGGGNQSDTRAAVREGFSRFLSPLREMARERDLGWHVTPCGSRGATFEKFMLALSHYPRDFNVLLVDAETAVAKPAWEHLRDGDGWPLSGTIDRHCHLMAQAVEAWMVADPDALAEFYGHGLHRGALPRRQDVEVIPKTELYAALNRATAACRKGKYHKIHHGSEILKRIRPERVRRRARHYDRLFTSLEDILRS